MTNNKQQTPVEWFFMTMNICGLLPTEEIVEYYNQAKEMEKERMIKFCIDWFISIEMNIKEYYKQTYGGGEQ